MWMRGRRKATAKAEGIAYEQIREKLDAALTTVFSEEGKRAVLYHMTEKYSLTLEQASANPRKLEDALTSLLGEVGWIVVKRKILEQFSGQAMENDVATIERASLNDAFGIFRSFVAYSPPALGHI